MEYRYGGQAVSNIEYHIAEITRYWHNLPPAEISAGVGWLTVSDVREQDSEVFGN